MSHKGDMIYCSAGFFRLDRKSRRQPNHAARMRRRGKRSACRLRRQEDREQIDLSIRANAEEEERGFDGQVGPTCRLCRRPAEDCYC